MNRLLVISSGSWEASIVGRNAVGRLLANRLDGFFDELDYVFFPAGVRGFHEPEKGVRVHEIPGRADQDRSPGWGARWRGLREGWSEIQGIASARPPSVVNAVEPFLSGFLGQEVARQHGIPFVSTVVSNYRLSWDVGGLNPVPFFPAPLSFFLEERVLSWATRIHVDCDHYAEYAESRGAAPSHIRQIPRYADPLFYTKKPDPGIWGRLQVPDSTPLVYVGRLSPEKYALELAETFLMVSQRQPERCLVVIGGGGPDHRLFLERVREGGVGNRVLVLTGLEKEEILSAMGAAGVLLATHAGYALLEAALVGAPVVAFDYEWHPELIQDGTTGLLVPYRDAPAMARAALELLNDRARAGAMGKALRGFVGSRYRQEDHMSTLRKSYLELLSVPGL